VRVTIVSKTYPLLAIAGAKVAMLAGTSEQSQHHGRSRPTIAEKRSSVRVRERNLHELGNWVGVSNGSFC